jgi:hypothetical protein
MSCERTPANRVTKENRKEYNLYFEGVKTNKDAMISETDGVTALIMDFRELEYISVAPTILPSASEVPARWPLWSR